MKDSPLDRLPDLDNANVGMTLILFITKKLLIGGFFFFAQEDRWLLSTEKT